MKPDSTRAAIVEAIRKVGGQWYDTESVAGFPDGVWAFRGRMGMAELKAPGKSYGVCGCTGTQAVSCKGTAPCRTCMCKGHVGTGNAERTTWHRQLAFREAWQGPAVSVWTTPEEALRTIGALPVPAPPEGAAPTVK
jgi:hypothetical protein